MHAASAHDPRRESSFPLNVADCDAGVCQRIDAGVCQRIDAAVCLRIGAGAWQRRGQCRWLLEGSGQFIQRQLWKPA